MDEKPSEMMWLGAIIVAIIVLPILAVWAILALGERIIRATVADAFLSVSGRRGISMKPSDLLLYLDSGDRTMDDVRWFVGEPNSTVGQILKEVKELKERE